MLRAAAGSGPARRPVYLDCAATTPLDPRVEAELIRSLREDFGNAGSRTHTYGSAARRAVEQARDRVAHLAGAARGEVLFTSGATESNNLALLGLEAHGRATGKRHIVTSSIEHHAVLEPIRRLEQRGFETTWIDPEPGGWVDPVKVEAALRDDTLLVSVMHVNNETGVRQPLAEIAGKLARSQAYFHVDAAQGFGKEIDELRLPRLDLISISGHKLCAPKGVGALICRRRDGERPPLEPLAVGGGQELGLRPGTLPVALIVALGKAAELADEERNERRRTVSRIQTKLLDGLAAAGVRLHGDLERLSPYIVNVSFPGLEAEEVMDAWQDLAAVSDGAACTSQSYTCSHVLSAMRLPPACLAGAVRLSWCHLSEPPDAAALAAALAAPLP
ncbi:MAG: aminotransferase class V-fold PLP-dependent enzyme [Bryobacterales bacterium]